MIVLGIETSCDETSAAVVSGGRRVLSSVVSSQFDLHECHGGVVPELAARRHVTAIVPVVEQALQEAGVDRDEIDAIAVTQGPGLAGALVVGVNAAKGMAYALADRSSRSTTSRRTSTPIGYVTHPTCQRNRSFQSSAYSSRAAIRSSS